MRKTKIICTLGPASSSKEMIRTLVLGGMDAARFNFSHSNYEEHAKRMQFLKEIRKETNLSVATILDTKGPEIRIGRFLNGKQTLQQGNEFVLHMNEIIGDESKASINYKGLVNDIKVGDRILLDDGSIELFVEKINVESGKIHCIIQNDGIIENHKGVNVPGVEIKIPFLSEKDKEDLLFGIEQGFDFVAASFTRCVDDILEMRNFLDEHNGSFINIIAKIENLQGVNNLDEILSVADGIMIARGDMGVEIPLEDVPVIQKEIIQKVYNAGKQVITATQMLESMIKNRRPTRAEATDISNAIYQGTSAIMLSGETAAGKYPKEALETMVKVAERTEEDINYSYEFKNRRTMQNPDITNAISHATCTTAVDLNASAIITVTKSGRTARMISKYRPDCPIIGCSTYERICRQLNLSWGVIPLLIQEEENVEQLFQNTVDTVRKVDLIQKDDVVVITSGVPLGVSGTTNLIKVQMVSI